MAKVGRNEPCACGSGRKYKACCLSREPAAPDTQVLHEMDRRLVTAMMAFAQHALAPGQLKAAFEDCPVAMLEQGESIVIPWLIFHADFAGTTIARRYLTERARDLPTRDREWIEAQLATRLTLWEVVEARLGESLRMRDLLGDDQRLVVERSASTQLVARDTLCARIVDFAGVALLVGMHPRYLPPREAAAVVGFLELLEERGELDRTHLLGEGAFAVLGAWDDKVDELLHRPPPVLHNTDGDKLQLTTDHFTVRPDTRREIEARLATLRGARRDEALADDGATVFVVERDGNRLHADWDNTVVGRVLVDDRALRVETNSTKRANALRGRIERLCGPLAVRRSRERHDLPGMMASDPRPAPVEAELPPPELQEIVRQAMRRHYEAWIDEAIPALGGKTPRQAARNKRDRPALELLLRDLENHEARRPAAERFDVGWLRGELGMVEDARPRPRG